MAAAPPSKTPSRVVFAVLAAAAIAVIGAGFWAARRGPGGDEPPNGAKGGAGRAPAADSAAPTPSAMLRVPGTGDPVIGAFDQGIRDTLASHSAPSEPLTGSVAIDAEDLVWRERAGEGPVFARAAAVSARLELGDLPRGDIRIHDAVLTRARVHLRESQGGWNYEVVMADLLNGDGDPDPASEPRTVRLDDVTIRDGNVGVRTLTRSFALENLDVLLGEAEFSAPALPEPRFVVDRGAADLALAGEPPIALTVEQATARILEDTVAFDVERGTVEGALLVDVHGDWSSSIPVFGVLARGRAVDVSLASVQRFLPDQAPREGTASFAWSIQESAAAPPVGKEALPVDIVLSDLDFTGEGSDIAGSIAFQVSVDRFALLETDLRFEPLDVGLVEVFAGPLPFNGTATGTVRGPADDVAVELAARLTMDDVADPIIGNVTGRVGVTTTDGFVLHGADAMFESMPLAVVRHWAPSFPLTGTASGRVTLSGPPGRAPLSLDLTLALAAGDATVAGTVDLAGPAPTYDLSGTLTGIDLEQLLVPDAPPVLLDARFALAGTGIRPEETDARIELDGQFRGWRAAERDGIAVVARARAGVLAIDTAWARLADAAASGAGEWRFMAPESGDIRYAATIASLDPWGPYIPVVGDSTAAGSLDLTGTLEGSLDRPRLSGELHGSDLQSGTWAAGTLEAAYAVLLGGPVPQGAIEVRASAFATPVGQEYRTVALSTSLISGDFELALDAERSGDQGVAIEATGTIPDIGPREIVAERVDIDLPSARWSLADSATFRWNEGAGLAVDGFELREDGGTGRVLAGGTLLPFDELDVELEVVALPVEEIEQLVGLDPVITGELGLTAQIEGPGSAPTADIELQLANGSIDEVEITRFNGTLTYAANRLTATASAAMGPGTFELDLELPALVDLDAERRFALAENGAVSGRLVANSVSITPLQRLSWRIQDLSGRLDGDVELAGSIADPVWSGQLLLTGGTVRVPELLADYSNIAGQLVLSDARASIESFEAQSDGLMTASGDITFDDLTTPALDVAVDFDGFRPLGVPGGREPAAVFGTVSLTGPVNELVLTGDVRFADGDIVVPQTGPPSADDMFSDFPELTANGTPAPPPTVEPSAGLTIEDLVVQVDRDVWVDAEAARAQLSGELVVNRTADTFEIEGTLAGERGTFTLEAGPIVRRFEILSAELTFRPDTPELDPTIDVRARRYLLDPNDRQVDVEVNIGGTLREPTLALASPGAPSFAQDELLSILLFGRSTLEPGSGQVAGQVLEGSIAELASLELEQALVRDLGLSVDVFQVRFGSGGIAGFGSPTFVIGVELTRDVFLTAESALGGLFSSTDATANAWAIRVEWAFRRNSLLRASFEPVTQSVFLRPFDLGLRRFTQKQQLSFDLRRRWTY